MASYDDFSETWTEKQRAGGNLSHAFLEKPAMYAELPELHDVRVLCLGCGSGEECAELKARGAARVLGIDSARGLIEQAKYSYTDCEFTVGDMSHIAYRQEFDFVYASLSVHYVEDFEALCVRVWQALAAGGTFLFSAHHPVKWGAQKSKGMDGSRTVEMSYTIQPDAPKWDSRTGGQSDNRFEIHGDYLNQYQIRDTWFGGLDVTYYNRSISAMFAALRAAGFTVETLREPKPISAAERERPSFYEIHSKIPQFVIFKAKKCSET